MPWSSFRQSLAATATVAAVLLSCAAAHASKVALVIGNSAYLHVAPLTNPITDAQEVANALTRLGFAVTRINDATYDRMRRAFLDFGRQARNAEIAAVFYAGHGIEVGGENWLIPVDAELKSDTDIEHEALGLKGVMLTVENTRRLGLIILDACRNNPFAATMRQTGRTRSVARGLAQVEPNANVLVAYSAKDGTLAADGSDRHSPFTAALLRHIETPGLEINFLFRNVRDDVLRETKRAQQPFVYGSLSREAIYLRAALQAPAAPGSTAPTVDVEMAFWNSIKDGGNVAAFEAYLNAYPAGTFAALARQRIVDLKQKAPAANKAPRSSKCFSFQGREFCE